MFFCYHCYICQRVFHNQNYDMFLYVLYYMNDQHTPKYDTTSRILKPCIDVASNKVAIDLRLDVQIACNDLQQKFKHAE